MDVENMHPFCLPFGFCHDATSSSVTADLGLILNDTSSSNNNNNNNNNSLEKDKMRSSKNSSPSDELFRHLNQATPSISQSTLLQHELIMNHSSATFDHIMKDSHDSFFSLEFDINIDADSSSLDAGMEMDFLGNDEEEDCISNGSDLDLKSISASMSTGNEDWYRDQFSLFSPPASNSNYPSVQDRITTRRKSLIRAALSNGSHHNHHNHHLVDPIDIKSSPTLAQLNLNNNDDPNDGIWNDNSRITNNGVEIVSVSRVDSSSSRKISSTSSLSSSLASNSSASLDLPQNCNSLTSQQSNHNQQHSHNQQQHHTQLGGQHQPSALHGAPMSCDRATDHEPRQMQYFSSEAGTQNTLTISSSCSTTGNQLNLAPCSVGATFHQIKTTDKIATTTSPSGCDRTHCCIHQSSTSTSATASAKPMRSTTNEISSQNLLSTGQSLLISSDSSASNHQHRASFNSQASNEGAITTNSQDCSQRPSSCLDQTRQPNTRPVSPALVTSSSSPQSHQCSSATSITPVIGTSSALVANQTGCSLPPEAQSSGRSDNKLKENIDYLTHLLCQGKKIDNSSQQPGISSTAMRSYTTLAQTLSTGPKLLSRSPYQMQGPPGQMYMSSNHPKSTSEASSRLSPSMVGSPASQHMKRPYQVAAEPWGLRVFQADSSVSAADSTELNQTMISPPDSCLRSQLSHPSQQIFCQQVAYQGHAIAQQVNENQRPVSSELKVLSSLLSGDNVCIGGSPIQRLPFGNEPQATTEQQVGASYEGNISPLAGAHQKMLVRQAADLAQSKMNQMAQQSVAIHEPGMVANGSPGQQQQQQAFGSMPGPLLSPATQDSRASIFVQPASPMQSVHNNFEAATGQSVDFNDPASLKRKRGCLGQQQQAQAPIISVPSPLVGAKSQQATKSSGPMSTDCSISSHDEGFSSQLGDNEDANSTTKDSDDEDDVDSDDESFYGDYTNNDLIGASISDDPDNKWILNMGRTRRNGQKRFFWQYNVQSKGPKGTRICSAEDLDNPFVLSEASDPVFSNDCQVEGVKHSGKARRGDGNDLTPNPKKLLVIGLELKKLGKIINDLAPVTELPVNARDKTRKEKNKLASRACRLKKKAQHEANKIKLYGLQREHQRIVSAIYEIRKALNEALRERDSKAGPLLECGKQQQQPLANSQAPNSASDLSQGNNDKLNSCVEMIAEQCSMKVAGQTSDYVNSVLEKVVAGCIDGGLQT